MTLVVVSKVTKPRKRRPPPPFNPITYNSIGWPAVSFDAPSHVRDVEGVVVDAVAAAILADPRTDSVCKLLYGLIDGVVQRENDRRRYDGW